MLTALRSVNVEIEAGVDRFLSRPRVARLVVKAVSTETRYRGSLAMIWGVTAVVGLGILAGGAHLLLPASWLAAI